jgi:hypothetical protein
MAKALSHIASTIRGSVAGLNYASSREHSITLRTRASPVNAPSNYRALIRSEFSRASVAWKNLSLSDKTSWEQYARSCPYQSPTGTHYLTGRSMFISIFSMAWYLAYRGLLSPSPATTPPSIMGWVSLANPRPVNIASGIGFRIELYNPNTQSIRVFGYLSHHFSPARFSFNGPFRGDTISYVSLAPNANGYLVFSGLINGQCYFVRIRALTSAAPIRKSIDYIVRAIAAPP